MASRSFSVTLPANTNTQNLWDRIIQEPNAIPTDGILPDRVREMTIVAASGNGAATIAIQDSTGDGGMLLAGGASHTWRSDRNNITLKDKFLKPSAVSLSFTINMEFT